MTEVTKIIPSNPDNRGRDYSFASAPSPYTNFVISHPNYPGMIRQEYIDALCSGMLDYYGAVALPVSYAVHLHFDPRSGRITTGKDKIFGIYYGYEIEE